jgi:antitoxin MazE
MLLKIVQIGNSQGITIPKAIMEQCELTDEVEGKKIILSAKKKVTEGWAELLHGNRLALKLGLDIRNPDIHKLLSICLRNLTNRSNQ